MYLYFADAILAGSGKEVDSAEEMGAESETPAAEVTLSNRLNNLVIQ